MLLISTHTNENYLTKQGYFPCGFFAKLSWQLIKEKAEIENDYWFLPWTEFMLEADFFWNYYYFSILYFTLSSYN